MKVCKIVKSPKKNVFSVIVAKESLSIASDSGLSCLKNINADPKGVKHDKKRNVFSKFDFDTFIGT